MKTAIFLSVRDKATRLPGKVLRGIKGKPIIEHLIDRLKKARIPDLIVMTTSIHLDDARLAQIAVKNQINCFRGSEDDKLQRYLDAADQYGVDFIAVVDGDDIFCDPICIDRVTEAFLKTGADYITCEGLPLGVTPFGVRVEALRQVCNLKAESDTEVWGGYFTGTDIFHTLSLKVEKRFRRPDLRMTLDYPEDFAFFEAVFKRLYRTGDVFSLDEIILLLDHHPEIVALNQGVQQLYRDHIKSAAPVRLKSHLSAHDSSYNPREILT